MTFNRRQPLPDGVNIPVRPTSRAPSTLPAARPRWCTKTPVGGKTIPFPQASSEPLLDLQRCFTDEFAARAVAPPRTRLH